VLTIPKSARADHVRENAGAQELLLGTSDLARIEEVFPLGAKPRTLPTL
jgi:diketogulonate reductase-like aldo/keto reductase